VVRCLYAYIMDKDREEIPYVEVPLHTLICLRPGTYGTVEERILIGPTLTAATQQPPPQRVSCDLDPRARQPLRRTGRPRSSVDELNAKAKLTFVA
jgi:6-phosphofructo-2-kinase/fructose-2,6-biphosphatase 2